MNADHLSQEKDVIEKAYEVTTNPEILDEFEKYWEAYLDMKLQTKSSADVDLKDAPINAHILRAIEIIERMGVLKSANTYAQNIVDSNYGLGFIVDKFGRIITYNIDAKPLVEDKDKLDALDFDEDSLREILSWIRKDVEPGSRDVMFRDVIRDNGDTVCIFIAPLKLVDEQDASTQYHFLITSVDFEVDRDTLNAIKERFGLTEAEGEIAVALLNGKNNSEIARLRNVSKSTVDKQVKEIRSKTNTRSVVEFVRRLGSMSAKMSSVNRQVSRVENIRSQKTGMIRKSVMVLKDGRRYEYVEQGHPRGDVVLNIHTLLGSGRLTPSSEIECVHRGWRFISPSRHGYGESDRANFSSVRDMIDRSVDDFCQLLDHLMIDKAIIIDAKYGQRFAALHPDRTKALVFINGTPQWHPSFLNNWPGRKRNMVKTSLHAPAAVRYLARVGYLLIQSGRERIFINGLNKENPVNMAALSDPEIYDVVAFGVRHVVAQGVEAHALDVQLMHTDQSSDARLVQAPVTLISGDKCELFPLDVVESYASLLRDSRVKEIKGAGSYLLHTHFDEVLRELERFRD